MDHWARLEQGAKILKTIGTTLLKKKEQAMEVQARYQKMKASIGQFLEKNIHAFLNFRGFDFRDFRFTAVNVQPSPFTMPINETPINWSKTGQKIVVFSLLFFSVI